MICPHNMTIKIHWFIPRFAILHIACNVKTHFAVKPVMRGHLQQLFQHFWFDIFNVHFHAQFYIFAKKLSQLITTRKECNAIFSARTRMLNVNGNYYNRNTDPICRAPPKGAKVYSASRRRCNKRVGLKGQLAPHCVPWLKKSIMAYKRLSTSLVSTLPVLRVLFWCNLFDVSSVFWLFFQGNLILIIILIDPV